MKFLALVAAASAISMGRDLAAEAQGEAAAWEAYEKAQAAVQAANRVYLTKKAIARKEERELQREIDETVAQEAVVKKANEAADKARGALFAATLAQHKAFEAYFNALESDKLTYTK